MLLAPLVLGCSAEAAPLREDSVVADPKWSISKSSAVEGFLQSDDARIEASVCSGTEPVRRRDRGVGETVRLVGRVTSSSGAGIPNATVTLVDLAMSVMEEPPRRGTRALVDTRTNQDGCFAIIGKRDGRWDDIFLSVESGEMRRTVDLHFLRDDDLSVRLAPSRAVRILVECRQGDALGTVTGYWHGADNDLFATRWLHPVGMEVDEDPLRSNFDRPPASLTEERASNRRARRAETDLRLPIGTSTLIVESGCGLAIQEVLVEPGPESLPPIHIRLPHPDAASISVRLGEPPRPDTVADAEGVVVALGEYFDRSVPLRRDGVPSRLDGLPPGEYRLGAPGRSECPHMVQLGPNEHRAFVLEPNDCAIWRWRRPDYF